MYQQMIILIAAMAQHLVLREEAHVPFLIQYAVCPCCELLCFAHSFMYQFPEATLGKDDWESKIQGSEAKIWEERFGFVPVFSHVLHLSSWKTSALCHKLGLPVELLNCSYSFFHSDDFLIINKAFLLPGDCFSVIF